MDSIKRIRQLAGLPITETKSPYNNQLETGGWSDGVAALKAVDGIYQYHMTRLTKWLDDDDFAYPEHKEDAQEKFNTVYPKKYKRIKDFIEKWQSQQGSHAPIAPPDKLLSSMRALSKPTVVGIERGMAELASAFGEIDWYEMQAAPHTKDDFGLGWTVRVEGTVKETGKPIQYSSASFNAPGAGQRFFRYNSNTKQPFNKLKEISAQALNGNNP